MMANIGAMSRSIFVMMALGWGLIAAQPAAGGAGEVGLAPSPSSQISVTEVLANLQERNRQRDTYLHYYSAIRIYAVHNSDGGLKARAVVQVQYESAGTKKFKILCEEGSSLVRSRVFKRLMESEADAAMGRSHHDSSITPANYEFSLTRQEALNGRPNFVLQATPKRKDKYLFEGEIWVDSQDFAIARIAGHPARNPSFWLKRVDFVRQYQRIGEFWLPSKDESVNQVKIFGKKLLTIEYPNYSVNMAIMDGPPPDLGLPEGCRLQQHSSDPRSQEKR